MVKTTTTDPLARYWAKRDFRVTSEPRGEHVQGPPGAQLSFVIQKHSATRLHYDFRLELDGVMLSWAVPRGPSLDPSERRLAVHVEDHPVSYSEFEGTIPANQYGAGHVLIWDWGTWEPLADPRTGLVEGKIVFNLHGQKLGGMWELVKIAKPDDKQEPWLLFKKRDKFARAKNEYDVVTALPDSVVAKPIDQAQLPIRAMRSTKLHDGEAHPVVEGAIRAQLPARLAPQLASPAAAMPSAGEWIYEIKFDGYRLMARIDAGKATLFTRGGHDWSSKMPVLVRELEALGLSTAWLDGEIVVLNEAGVPSFNALQNALDSRARAENILYFLFDVPYLEGYDLRASPLSARRQLLQSVHEQHSSEHLRFSANFEADVASILASARRMNLEGVVAKRADAPYVSRRSDSWLKLKCRQRQEFVVCGYTDRGDGAAQIGSLLLGVHEKGGPLVFVGGVGTGWSSDEATKLKTLLAKLDVAKAPFAEPPTSATRWSKRAVGSERWVTPKLVVEVEFADWTPEGRVRHAVYLGLRKDKPAAMVTRDAVVLAPANTKGSVKVTHGERVIDASTGLTKLDLVRYYESVAAFMLPHLRGRPCSLVRGPNGVAGQLFFQKHAEQAGLPGIRNLDPALWPGHEPLLEVPSTEALVAAAQMNVIEFHTWNTTAKHIDKPDRMIFDLDPGEGTPWQHVQEAALLVRALLTELGLAAWLKTSGGKGLHVVVPLTPKLSGDVVKGFSEAVVQHLTKTIPQRFVAKSGAANRVGKLFVDYLRNNRGATTAAAFSARARPGLGVSMPVTWDEVTNIKSGAQWTIATARDHLSFQTVDPWAEYWQQRQTLTVGMKRLGVKPDR